MSTTAKLFITGTHQAVRLPKQCHFDGDEVLIRKDPVRAGVILSPKPASWEEFFALADRSSVPDDFLAERQDLPTPERKRAPS